MEWNDVKQKLPEEKVPVLVCDKDNYMITAQLLSKKNKIWAYTDLDYFYPTHWMPLPKQPERLSG